MHGVTPYRRPGYRARPAIAALVADHAKPAPQAVKTIPRERSTPAVRRRRHDAHRLRHAPCCREEIVVEGSQTLGITEDLKPAATK